MARKKRGSKLLVKAELRLLGMQAIDPQLDLGNGFSVQTYTHEIDAIRQKLDTYNRLLSNLDALASEITEGERQLSTFSAKILSSIACLFGKNSSEYEKVGGVRRVERQRVTRRQTAAVMPAEPVAEPVSVID